MEPKPILQITHVYCGMMPPFAETSDVLRHDRELYYFAPKDFSGGIPFSRGSATQELAEKAAAAWEARFELSKLYSAETLAQAAA